MASMSNPNSKEAPVEGFSMSAVMLTQSEENGLQQVYAHENDDRSEFGLNHVVVNQRANTKLQSVELHNAHKHYGIYNHWTYVLKGCNLKANTGELYTLLGPKDSGKSTILNILLGYSKLSKGEVKVFGSKPNSPRYGIPGARVGFMPQNQGLHSYLSIDEAIRYNAKLLDLEKHYMNKRIAFLYKFLRLPKDSKKISFYDKAVRQRILFGLAIFHEPELLILDEPTTGLDPFIEFSVWKYLVNLTTEKNITIIVALQSPLYVEHAHRVGILTNGMIEIEGNPRIITRKNNLKSMSDIMCRAFDPNQQAIAQIIENCKATSNTNEHNFRRWSSGGFSPTLESLSEKSMPTAGSATIPPRKKCCKFPNLWRLIPVLRLSIIWILLSKHMLCLLRHYRSVIACMLLPLPPIMLFIMSGYEVAIDLDFPIYNAEVVDFKNNCTEKYFSCIFLRHFGQISSFKINQLDEWNGVQSYDHFKAVLYIPSNISEDFRHVIKRQTEQRIIYSESKHSTSMLMEIFTTSPHEMFHIKRTVMEAVSLTLLELEMYQQFLVAWFPFHDGKLYRAPNPLSQEESINNNLAPVSIFLWLIFISKLLFGLLHHELRRGNVYRAFFALGVRRWELVISLTITMVALLSLHTLLLVFGFLSYYEMKLGIPMTTGITLMHLHILLAGVIGWMIGIIATNKIAIAFITLVWITLTECITAVLEFNKMSKVAKIIGKLLPHSDGNEVFQHIFVFDLKFSDSMVYQNMCRTFLWILVYMALACIVFVFRER